MACSRAHRPRKSCLLGTFRVVLKYGLLNSLLELVDIYEWAEMAKPPHGCRPFFVTSHHLLWNVLGFVGDVFGPVFNDTINSLTMIRMPHQGGEMSVFSFAMNLYSLDFLRRTNQLTDVEEKRLFTALNACKLKRGNDTARRDTALSFLVYQTICNYQDYYGPFHQFMNETILQNSVWLTSFAIQVFEESRKLLQYSDWENNLYIDPLITEQCVRWILQHQTPEGSFFERFYAPFDRKMAYHVSLVFCLDDDIDRWFFGGKIIEVGHPARNFWLLLTIWGIIPRTWPGKSQLIFLDR